MKSLIRNKVRNGILKEGLSNYWPGYSDDGTADWLGTIRDETSPILNKELEKAEKKIRKPKSDAHYKKWDYSTKEKDEFWGKWQMANMIMTSLQDGFYIESDLFDKAKEYYQEVLKEAKKDKGELFDDGKGYFVDSIEAVLKAMEELSPMSGEYGTFPHTGMYYSPNFMERNSVTYSEIRDKIDSKHDKSGH